MTDESAENGINEDGILWMGTRAELDAWKLYKQEKALAFVKRGYSVSWYADGDGWMDVYIPERHHAKTPEIRASVKFYSGRSQHGIASGRISKLSITRTRTSPMNQVMGVPADKTEVLYNYDRGADVDELRKSVVAKSLLQAILEELN